MHNLFTFFKPEPVVLTYSGDWRHPLLDVIIAICRKHPSWETNSSFPSLVNEIFSHVTMKLFEYEKLPEEQHQSNHDCAIEVLRDKIQVPHNSYIMYIHSYRSKIIILYVQVELSNTTLSSFSLEQLGAHCG